MKLPDFSIGPRSQTLVVLVIFLISLLKNIMSYSFVFGGLSTFAPGLVRGPLETGWSLLRFVVTGGVVVLWLVGRKRQLFRAIIVANSVFTLGLILTTASLVSILFGFKASGVGVLLFDVFLLATANILVFSIWYWIIDPPGIDVDEPLNTPWDFLFPQRSNPLSGYEQWEPRYSDYLFLAPVSQRRNQNDSTVGAALLGLPLSSLHHDLRLQPDRHAPPHPPRQAVDDAPGHDLRGDIGRRRRRGGECVVAAHPPKAPSE